MINTRARNNSSPPCTIGTRYRVHMRRDVRDALLQVASWLTMRVDRVRVQHEESYE